MDTNTVQVISEKVLESTAQDMTGKYVWMFLAGLVILIFKSSIEKLAAALFMFIGSDYKEDDVVYVDGKPGRIVRVGLTKTVFFIYDVVEGKVVGGSKLVIQNERLAGLNIEKPLPQLDLTRFKKENKQDGSYQSNVEPSRLHDQQTSFEGHSRHQFKKTISILVEPYSHSITT